MSSKLVRLAAMTGLPVIMAIALVPGSALAATPGSQIFRDLQQSVSGTPGVGNTYDVVSIGSSTASGTVSGTFEIVDHAVISPGGTLQVDRMISDSTGSIAMRIDALFVGETATTESVAGRWVITSGTGPYAALAGRGSYVATVETATHTVIGVLDGFALFGPAT